MSGAGAAFAAIAVAAMLLGSRRRSGVARRLGMVAPPSTDATRRWRPVSPARLRQAGLAISSDQLLGVKIAAALAGALAAALATLAVPLGPAAVALAAYVGFVVPSLVVDHRAASRRAAAERGTVVLVERLEALVAAGRPAETALAILVRRPTGAPLLDGVLRQTHEAYVLGAPLFRTLEANARSEALETCAAVARDLDRARDLAAGSLAAVRERRAGMRAAERARLLEAAAQVEGKLMLVLVLCYLPALLLLVVIPLFIGLLEGLFT